MIFDSVYDTYRGVVTYVRVVDGRIVPREKIAMMSTGATHEFARGRHRLARAKARARAWASGRSATSSPG